MIVTIRKWGSSQGFILLNTLNQLTAEREN